MSADAAKTFVVHNLEPKTLPELARMKCGHCQHRLSWHVTKGEDTYCSACHCRRHPGEDILRPHQFKEARLSRPGESRE